MTQITIDPNLSGRLQQLIEPVDLCDPSGRVLGRFVPKVEQSEWEPVTPGISEAELKRRRASAEARYSTEQVIAHLNGFRD